MKKGKRALSIILTAALLVGLLPIAAVAAAPTNENRVLVEAENFSGKSMNLTEVGTVDWIFVGNQYTGNRYPDPADATPAERKADSAGDAVDVIQYGNLKDTTLFDWWAGGTNATFSWTDGANSPVGGSSTATALVYAWYGSWTSGDAPEGVEAGWTLSIPASDDIQKLTFVTAAAWAGTELSVYVNNDMTSPVFVDDKRITGSQSFNWKYTLTIAPGTAIDVHGKMSWVSEGAGEIALMGAALSTLDKDSSVDYVAQLTDSVDLANAWLMEDIDNALRTDLEYELAICEPLLAGSPTNDEAYVALTFLGLVLAIAEATPVTGDFANTYAAGLSTFFGWEGDDNAPIAWADGTYLLRSNRSTVVNFGVSDLPANSVTWSRAEGYLPSLVSEYSSGGSDHTVENFADEVTIDSRRFEVAYSRMTSTNTTQDIRLLPRVSGSLVPINDAAANTKVAQAGETVVREYAIFADRLGGKYPYPADEVLPGHGTWQQHYDHMRDHWDARLADVVDLAALPGGYARMAEAYKAAYIDLLIAADGYELRSGEESGASETVTDRESLNMLAALVQLGHTEDFADYAAALLSRTTSPDVAWQMAWPFALYVQKTGDLLTAADFFEDQGRVAGVKTNTRKIAQDRVICDASVAVGGTPAKVMKQTDSMGTTGYWVADNFAALQGLTAYRYLCEQLYAETGLAKYAAERDWAAAEYESLLAGVEGVIQSTMTAEWLTAIPMNMMAPNGATGTGSWVAHYLPGQWSWNRYLLGAGESPLLDLTDATYAALLRQNSDTPYNLGGDGCFSTSYNAGYFSGALGGESYRAYGVEAYQWMIDQSMSVPYGWWEHSDNPDDSTLLAGTCVSSGTGNCPHIPGQIAGAQMLIDAFLTEKADGTLIAGRGLPIAFNAPGERVEINNFLCNSGQRLGFTMLSEAKSITFTLTGEPAEYPVSLELLALKDNIAFVSGNCTFDNAAGTVLIPVGTTSVTVALKAAADVVGPVISAINAIGAVTASSAAAIQAARAQYDALSAENQALVTNYQTLVNAEKAYQNLISAPPTSDYYSAPSTPAPVVKTDVTETAVLADGTKVVTVTKSDGTVIKTATSPDGRTVETEILPGEGVTVTAQNADGKIVSKVAIPAELPVAKAFEDVGPGHAAYKSVATVSALGLFEGTGETIFSPNGSMSRGMIVTVLHRLSGKLTATAPESFADVSSSAWYGAAVAWAAENHIVQGVGGGLYAPDEEVSREMLITILCRYAVILGLDTGAKDNALASYADSGLVSTWAEPSMAWAAERGLIDELAPDRVATRVEVAIILAKFIDLLRK